MRKTTEIFIQRAKTKHGNKYDYSKVEYIRNTDKVCIICPKHGEFWQTPKVHESGSGCPKCGYNTIRDKVKLTQDEFIRKCKEVHGDKYDYSRVNYVKLTESIVVICPVHGEFTQLALHHYSGCGCPKCVGFGKTTEDFVTDARKVHGDIYDYSKTEYISVKDKVKIICPEHGEFWQRPDIHLSGHGCPECGKERQYLSLDDLLDRFFSIYGDKYDYSRIEYNGINSEIEIVCPEHGSFFRTPFVHLRGHGCPKCARSVSSYEEFCYDELLTHYNKDDIKREYDEDERYPFHCDFYIKSEDLFIEINGYWTHGGHWFDENNEDDIKQLNELRYKAENSSLCARALDIWIDSDVKKREYARKNNLNYVVLWNKQDIIEWFKEGHPIRQDWM